MRRDAEESVVVIGEAVVVHICEKFSVLFFLTMSYDGLFKDFRASVRLVIFIIIFAT